MLATPDRWQMVDRMRDPLASEAPVDGDCDPYAVVFEGPHLEVDTRACSYAVLEQAALTAAAPGERLTGAIWHLGLIDELPATAHVALAVGGSVIWEQWVDIPNPPTAWELDVHFESNVKEDAAIVFHLHNHGANQWRVGELRVEAP
jgi:hypothetical protein